MSDAPSNEQAATPTGVRWGDPIDETRKQALWTRLRAWWEEANHGKRAGPFENEKLTGAEVFWLAICAFAKHAGTTEDIAEIRLRAAKSYWSLTLTWLCLQGAVLNGAQLQGAVLIKAQVQGANLSDAQLEGADLRRAQLVHADVRRASLDKKTRLSRTILTDVRLDGAIFDNTNLSEVEWTLVPQLQDERIAHQSRFGDEDPRKKGQRKPRAIRHDEYQAAVRAYRLLAVALQSRGMNEEASRYSYRAQIMQRGVYRHGGWRSRGHYLSSWLLAVSAGYGYRLDRILIAYAGIVLMFTLGFLLTGVVHGQTTLSAPTTLDALQISLNAIHGRVFFAQFGLDTLQSWLATIESVFGIVIESLFAAMLIQRFFSR